MPMPMRQSDATERGVDITLTFPSDSQNSRPANGLSIIVIVNAIAIY